MLFLTYVFAVFCAVFFPLYWIAWNQTARWCVLILGCLAFHTWFAGPAGVLPIVVLGLSVYVLGRIARRWSCILGIVLVVSSLLFYKYSTFLIATALAHFLSQDVMVRLTGDLKSWLPGAPPLAISFFAFEFVHYLTEVMRGRPAIRRAREFVAFAVFWPSLVAGPIKRYEQFLPALAHGIASVSSRDVCSGMARVVVGGLKKVVADNLTAFISAVEPSFEGYPFEKQFIVVLAISLRILLDFSGYSDMAIGCARMMGVALPENFRWPYLARSISDFWGRWHISLSSWIKDYVYIPLGGSRHGMARRITNGLIAFSLCGLWHGAAWNFIVWGLYHGTGLAVHSFYRSWLAGRLQLRGARLHAYDCMCWLLTQVFVSVGWLLFFYPLDRAIAMLRAVL